MHTYFYRKEHTYCRSTVSLRIDQKYGKNPVSTDGGDGGSGTWYPKACRFLKLRHHTHSLLILLLTLLRKKYHYRTNYSIHKKDR